MHHFAVPGDQRDGPGQQVLVDVPLHQRADALQTLGRHADLFRTRHRQVVIFGPAGTQDRREKRQGDDDGECGDNTQRS